MLSSGVPERAFMLICQTPRTTDRVSTSVGSNEWVGKEREEKKMQVDHGWWGIGGFRDSRIRNKVGIRHGGTSKKRSCAHMDTHQPRSIVSATSTKSPTDQTASGSRLSEVGKYRVNVGKCRVQIFPELFCPASASQRPSLRCPSPLATHFCTREHNLARHKDQEHDLNKTPSARLPQRG